MGIFDRISKSIEQGKIDARNESARREARQQDFNRAMDRSDAREERHYRQAEEARSRGDTAGYNEHLGKAARERSIRNMTPNP